MYSRQASSFRRRLRKVGFSTRLRRRIALGVTSTFIDRLVGSYYEDRETRPRSAHIYDLGYDAAEAERYPWVAARTQPAADGPRSR